MNFGDAINVRGCEGFSVRQASLVSIWLGFFSGEARESTRVILWAQVTASKPLTHPSIPPFRRRLIIIASLFLSFRLASSKEERQGAGNKMDPIKCIIKEGEREKWTRSHAISVGPIQLSLKKTRVGVMMQ